MLINVAAVIPKKEPPIDLNKCEIGFFTSADCQENGGTITGCQDLWME